MSQNNTPPAQRNENETTPSKKRIFTNSSLGCRSSAYKRIENKTEEKRKGVTHMNRPTHPPKSKMNQVNKIHKELKTTARNKKKNTEKKKSENK